MITAPFTISRVFDAPRGEVWKAWTEAERLKKWWGPAGFKVHTCKVDLRPGGIFLYGMTAPDGSDMWGKMAYREIEAPKKLVFINSFSDPKGGVTRHPWHQTWPLEMLSTITFDEVGSSPKEQRSSPKEQGAGKTKVTVHWVPAESSSELECRTFDEGRDSMKQGWGGTMNQLTDHLKRDRK
jgi:uncharacterized protein YndB with AHSA1/START domain